MWQVNADIGPISLSKQRRSATLYLADDKIEYAQLTVHADKDIKLQSTTQKDTHSAGNYYNVSISVL